MVVAQVPQHDLQEFESELDGADLVALVLLALSFLGRGEVELKVVLGVRFHFHVLCVKCEVLVKQLRETQTLVSLNLELHQIKLLVTERVQRTQDLVLPRYVEGQAFDFSCLGTNQIYVTLLQRLAVELSMLDSREVNSFLAHAVVADLGADYDVLG